VNESTVTIEDLGSKNGTYLSGTRLTSLAPVKDGDEIELGSVMVTLRIFDASGSTETRHSGARTRQRQ
jgi:pSer/pThr/pTyr-binding forkhead associated (FHA) protein